MMMRCKSRKRPSLQRALPGLIWALTALAGCGEGQGQQGRNLPPAFLRGAPVVTHFDGTADDLLTGGLGQAGLSGALPSPKDPLHPTAAELRRLAVVNQYRALKDLRPEAGFGTLYGPAVPGLLSSGDSRGRIAGKEYLAYDDDGTGQQNVTMLVQIPAHFKRARPCIIATASSGSRGVYGAIGTVGEWGLKNGCVVAHTDKGTGNGLHDLGTDTVDLIDGTREAAAQAGTQANFHAQGTGAMDLKSFSSAFPGRIAQKHAHSMQNPEALWGQRVLHAIEFAFYVLNLPENYGQASGSDTLQTITKAGTLVIAAGVSNGGAAVLRAAEQDEHGLIDGVVALEPQIDPQKPARPFSITQGSLAFAADVVGRPLLDHTTFYAVLQPCASANTLIAAGSDPALGAPAMGGAPAGLQGRCAALHAAGILATTTPTAQAEEAQARLDDFGLVPSSHVIAHPYNSAALYIADAVAYASAYGRFSVVDSLCGYSYGVAAGSTPPQAIAPADLAQSFATNNGAPPTGTETLINNSGNGGRGVALRAGTDAAGNLDEDLPGALCLRHLATGTTGLTAQDGAPLTGADQAAHDRVQAGLQQILATGDLRRKPALIVHGRDDALVPVNFSSRAYYGLNQRAEGAASQLAYVEVLHANHLDTLNQRYNINTQVPLLYYLDRALDRMYQHLRGGAALPRSQVVRTVPLGQPARPGHPALTAADLPGLDDPGACPITFTGDTLDVPECSP